MTDRTNKQWKTEKPMFPILQSFWGFLGLLEHYFSHLVNMQTSSKKMSPMDSRADINIVYIMLLNHEQT